ncbi:MAG: isoprenylcysteine carboxylmethyltransferase family protein [Gammaproteobacteria bacterium]|nr:isoprenylcysteine carboxylmethyltransferase family protein [Gammaproteobacteria bacterium]
MTDFIRIFLPIYLIVFIFAVFLLRTFIVWKKTGVNAYALLKQEGAEGVVARYFKLVPLASIFVVFTVSVFPSAYTYLAPFYWLEELPAVTLSGLFLLIVSLIWIWISQTQMGNSWRIGIDKTNETDLVVNGVFLISRNPIFLGLAVNLVGFFLVIPNAATLAIMLLGIAIIEIQVALEEQHLLNLHNDNYVSYCKNVRRWL